LREKRKKNPSLWSEKKGLGHHYQVDMGGKMMNERKGRKKHSFSERKDITERRGGRYLL